MLKSSKLMKILVLFILVGCLVPAVTAKKTGEVIARGRGKASWTKDNGVTRKAAVRVRLVGDVEHNSEGGVNFPIKCVLKMIVGSEKQGEILKVHAWCLPEVDDEVLVGFKVEINGQSLPIRSVIGKNGKTIWVTKNAVMDIKGQEIELNLIWKLNIVLEDYQINNVPEL